MKDLKVWIRLGDNAEYESCDTPFEAGERLGELINFEPVYHYRHFGVEIDGFTSMNYISLYWGDDDAQPVDDSGFNDSDKQDFESGVSNAEKVF